MGGTNLDARTRVCSRCDIEKPFEDFHRMTKDKVAGLQPYCKTCVYESRVVRHAENPDYYKDIKLRHLYGVSYEVYEQMLADQGGVCAICQGEETYAVAGTVRMLSVDHDHVTNAVRGLLCQKCNSAIGMLNDDPVLLQRATDYVKGR